MSTSYTAFAKPPLKETFFQVAMMACLGSKASDPITPVRISHFSLSLISTPIRSVLVNKSLSILKYIPGLRRSSSSSLRFPKKYFTFKTQLLNN